MIGVFDSGIGGLTVLDALRRRLPRRDFVYLADTARLPYGPRPLAEVREFARNAASFLLEIGVEGMVVACNTASAAALHTLRTELPVPVWGVIDAGVEAVTRLASGSRVGVIATEATIASGVYQRKLGARGFQVWAQACPALVAAVEAASPEIAAVTADSLRGMPRVDTLLLGCTHFPLVRDVIQRVAGPRVMVIDGADTLARTVAADVEDEGEGRTRYLVTGDPERFARSLRTRHREIAGRPIIAAASLDPGVHA